MNKAILVIDMPTVCGNCELEQHYTTNHKSYSYCGACGISTKNSEILTDCPLKPLPKELEPGISDEYVNYCQGFNDCINEILGEEKNG